MLSLQEGLCAREDSLKCGSLKTFDVSSSFLRKSSTFCGSARREMRQIVFVGYVHTFMN